MVFQLECIKKIKCSEPNNNKFRKNNEIHSVANMQAPGVLQEKM